MITEISFVEALPGLSSETDFTLAALDEGGHLFALRGTGADPTRLFLMRPEPYFQAYSPAIDPTVLAALDLPGSEDGRCAVLVIVTPRADERPATANLLAPVVLNTETGLAQQVILDGASWPLRAPLVAA